MLKKFLTSIILVVLILGGLYGYFLYAGDPSVLRNRISNNRQYTAIFLISIVMLVCLRGTGKLFKLISFGIILINLYLFGDLFFRNNIGLESRQFMVLFGLIIVALATTYIRHRIRYIVMGIIGLGIAFVLVTGTLPMYESIPSIENFVSSQSAKIINPGIQWGILTIKNAQGTKQIPISELQSNDIDLSSATQISFASSSASALQKLFIDLGNGAIIDLKPQSAITLQQSGEETTLQIIQGNIEYYLPDQLSWTLHTIGNRTAKRIQNDRDDSRSAIIDQFQKKKQEFFINQLGGTMILNPTINKLIKYSINALYTINPKKYQINLTNYNNIQHYLWIATGSRTNAPSTGESMSNMIDNLMGQIKKWAGETQFFDQIFDR